MFYVQISEQRRGPLQVLSTSTHASDSPDARHETDKSVSVEMSGFGETSIFTGAFCFNHDYACCRILYLHSVIFSSQFQIVSVVQPNCDSYVFLKVEKDVSGIIVEEETEDSR